MAYYTREEFVKKYGNTINRVTKGTGIFPETLIDQAILESSGMVDGTSYVGASGLSQRANNYFGIKAGSGWKGKVYNVDTGEYTPSGEYYVLKGAAFRAYNSVEDSMKDYINVLTKNATYKNNGVFSAKTAADQARALQKAGYATSPTYADTLIRLQATAKEYLQKTKSFAKENWMAISVTMIGLIGLTYYLVQKKQK